LQDAGSAVSHFTDAPDLAFVLDNDLAVMATRHAWVFWGGQGIVDRR